MAFYTDRPISPVHARATARLSEGLLNQGLRLPVMTLVLGGIASLVIAAGALDWLPVNGDITGELSNVEFLVRPLGE